MKKILGLIFCLSQLCNFAGAQINGNIHEREFDPATVSDMSSPACVDCGENYMKTNKTVEIYTESGHRKGTYSVWLCRGDKYIKFNNDWIRIEGKSRFFYHGNAYVIK